MECYTCKCSLNEETAVKTDDFQTVGATVKSYCGNCYIKAAKTYIEVNNLCCDACGEKLVFQYDDLEEVISLGQDEAILPLDCPKHKQAEHDDDLYEKLGEEGHDIYWPYILCLPDPEVEQM